MATQKLAKTRTDRIDLLVKHYVENKELFARCLDQVKALFSNSESLGRHVHSMKWRLKDPDHLKDKLIRKWINCENERKPFDINKENLFQRFTDLVGFRILHLHTRQIDDINKIVLRLLRDEGWVLQEGPVARTWDDESRKYFQTISIETKDSSNTMYTSVHYVFKANKQAKCSCELQVRTLSEELWGEVDHKINYPHPHSSIACREQIKVLARVTSSCTRLVDSIFNTHEVYNLRLHLTDSESSPGLGR